MNLPQGFNCRESSEDGQTLFSIDSGDGYAIELSNFGASVRSFTVDGLEITVGLPDAKSYRSNNYFHAVTVGRYANRIKHGKTTVEGKQLSLPINNADNHLHGGPGGFHNLLWEAHLVSQLVEIDGVQKNGVGVIFSLDSKEGDQGYPGNVKVQTLILLVKDGGLLFAYRAVTDKATPFNMTNHTYWNLAGAGKDSVHQHRLVLDSVGYFDTPTGIPDGTLSAMKGSAFDFSTPRILEEVIAERGVAPRPEGVKGVDHNFVIDPKAPQTALALVTPLCFTLKTEQAFKVSLRRAAVLRLKGLSMQVLTDKPGLQVYTGNFMAGGPGRNGPLAPNTAVCLESQLFPDSPNQVEAYKKIGASLGFAQAELDSWDGILAAKKLYQSMTYHQFYKA